MVNNEAILDVRKPLRTRAGSRVLIYNSDPEYIDGRYAIFPNAEKSVISHWVLCRWHYNGYHELGRITKLDLVYEDSVSKSERA